MSVQRLFKKEPEITENCFLKTLVLWDIREKHRKTERLKGEKKCWSSLESLLETQHKGFLLHWLHLVQVSTFILVIQHIRSTSLNTNDMREVEMAQRKRKQNEKSLVLGRADRMNLLQSVKVKVQRGQKGLKGGKRHWEMTYYTHHLSK